MCLTPSTNFLQVIPVCSNHPSICNDTMLCICDTQTVVHLQSMNQEFLEGSFCKLSKNCGRLADLWKVNRTRERTTDSHCNSYCKAVAHALCKTQVCITVFNIWRIFKEMQPKWTWILNEKNSRANDPSATGTNTTPYQAIFCSLIPVVPFNTFFFNSLFQFIKDIVMLFSFLFCHESRKFFLQGCPCHLES